MPLNRRNMLYVLACATGFPATGRSAIVSAVDGQAAESLALQSSVAPPHAAPPPEAGLPAERVVGIGGLFFRAKDPKALSEWYRIHLGVTPTPTSLGDTSWHTEAGTTVFAPFPQTTKYFEPSQMWMVNFRVRDLEKMAAQLRAAGVIVTVDPELYPNGRFGRTHDPEGNPIELWEPAGRDASKG